MLEDEFRDRFYKLVEIYINKFHKDDQESRDMVGIIINNFLDDLIKEAKHSKFIDVYKKHLNGTLYVSFPDFTKSEIEEIINEARLSDKDKEIAKLYYADDLSDNQIYQQTGVEPRTLKKKVPTISLALKESACKIYSK